MIGRAALPGLVLFAALAFDAPAAFAAGCTGPTANSGAQFYNSTFNVMQYCNGTSWINMGVNVSGGIGTLTSGDFCTTDGLNVNCTTSTPLAVTLGGTGVSLAQGNGTKVQLSSGSATSGDCVKFDANGNTVDTGAACASTSLASGDIWIGNGSSVATATALPLSVANGGTGASALTGYLYGNGTSAVTANSVIGVANGGTGLSSSTANQLFAGPSSGSAAAPAFRALVTADLPSSAALLTTTDQTLSGGVNVTSSSQGTKSSGTYTVDCGQAPLQYITNGGAFTLAAPSNDGSCIVLVINNGSAGTITFSGFSEGSNTGDSLTTTNGNKFSIQIWRIDGTVGYRVAAHQ